MTQTPGPGSLLPTAEQQLADLVTHAGKPGFATSEFWVQLLTPPASFAFSALVSWLVVHGITTQPIADQVAPPASAALVSAVATWAARGYVAARTALKGTLLAHVVASAAGPPAGDPGASALPASDPAAVAAVVGAPLPAPAPSTTG